MRTKYHIITTAIASLHWIYYGMTILITLINAETWFFGTKINGDYALLLHLTYGTSGFIVGYFTYRQKKMVYVLSIVLFVFVIISFKL